MRKTYTSLKHILKWWILKAKVRRGWSQTQVSGMVVQYANRLNTATIRHSSVDLIENIYVFFGNMVLLLIRYLNFSTYVCKMLPYNILVYCTLINKYGHFNLDQIYEKSIGHHLNFFI